MIGGTSVGRDAAELLEAHIPGLRRYACALLRGDRARADDLVQDSLERALSRWHQRRSDGDLRGWIYTILYRRFLTDRRRQRSGFVYESLTDVLGREEPGVVGAQEGALAQRDILRGLAELPEEQRSVLLLIAVEDFSYEQAALILEVPLGTVMSRLSRGRERLRRYLNGDRIRRRQREITGSSRRDGRDERTLNGNRDTPIQSVAGGAVATELDIACAPPEAGGQQQCNNST